MEVQSIFILIFIPLNETKRNRGRKQIHYRRASSDASYIHSSVSCLKKESIHTSSSNKRTKLCTEVIYIVFSSVFCATVLDIF